MDRYHHFIMFKVKIPSNYYEVKYFLSEPPKGSEISF
jgi:hypothetical protein